MKMTDFTLTQRLNWSSPIPGVSAYEYDIEAKSNRAIFPHNQTYLSFLRDFDLFLDGIFFQGVEFSQD